MCMCDCSGCGFGLLVFSSPVNKVYDPLVVQEFAYAVICAVVVQVCAELLNTIPAPAACV